jgi:Domain of unknown function DUF29
MNKPAHPIAAPPPAYPDYHKDGYGWAMAQAAIIRAGRLDSIDWENVAEEIESVGKSERSGVESALRVLMMHILKWEYQPNLRGTSWALSIKNQRQAYQDGMAENPSLKPELDAMRARAYRRSRIVAAQETDLPLSIFSEQPLDWPTILDAPFEFLND